MTLGKPMILANRYLFNPVYKNFTWFVAPFGTVVTRDRHTGKVYSVPMGVYPLDGDRVMIPMSYSRNVNWVTNVLADGGAQVWYKGKGKQYQNPHFISAKEAYDLMPVALTGTYRAVDTTEFMVLDPIPGAPVDSAKPMKAVAKVNKSVVNPIQLRYADKIKPMAVVTHVGRKSGNVYKTPVMALVSKGSGRVMLPYGTDTDWVKNFIAAGKATVVQGGRTYEITDPVVNDGVVPTLSFSAQALDG